ncbi:unnamed protein product [Periconia digitata]|uniref:Uncharacterized protein n=1 Tax=Periconia digitata TaxID=1303443 RepID=A0A9W4U286_9PLEO|nr:unnamed protein product [Periconia digitata]
MTLFTQWVIYVFMAVAYSLPRTARDANPADPKQCGWIAPSFSPSQDPNNLKVNKCRSVLLPGTEDDVKYTINPDCHCTFFNTKICDPDTEVVDAAPNSTGAFHYMENNIGYISYKCQKL